MRKNLKSSASSSAAVATSPTVATDSNGLAANEQVRWWWWEFETCATYCNFSSSPHITFQYVLMHTHTHTHTHTLTHTHTHIHIHRCTAVTGGAAQRRAYRDPSECSHDYV